MAWRAWLPDERAGAGRATLIGLAAAAAGTLLRLALTPLVDMALPFITYFPFLLAAGLWGGGLGGALALAASAAAAGLLFFEPETPHLIWGLASFVLSGGLLVVVGSAMAETVRSLRAAQARQTAVSAELQTLVGELAHRGRNAIAVFSALAIQSLRSAETLEEGETILTARLDALARAQDEVVRAGGGAPSISALVPKTLEPFGLERFTIDLDSAGAISPEAATALALMLHELATNAVKYGALSGRGHVEICSVDAGDRVRIRWQEVDGPPVVAPRAAGFGARLLSVGLEPHGGRAERRFEPTGVVCDLELPHAPPAA